MREKLEQYVALLYSKNYNAYATAINESLQGCSTEADLQRLWNDTNNTRQEDGFV